MALVAWPFPTFLEWGGTLIMFYGLRGIVGGCECRKRELDEGKDRVQAPVEPAVLGITENTPSRTPRKVWRNKETGWLVLISQSRFR